MVETIRLQRVLVGRVVLMTCSEQVHLSNADCQGRHGRALRAMSRIFAENRSGIKNFLSVVGAGQETGS